MRLCGAFLLSNCLQLIFLCGLLSGFFPEPASAHEVRPAFVKVTEKIDENNRNYFEASFRQPQVNGRFLGLTLVTNCPSTAISASVTDGALVEVFELDCDSVAGAGANSLTQIEIVGLDRTLIDTLVSITRLNGEVINRLITAQQTTLDLSSAIPAVPVYFSIGIKHLLLGFDHILFVLMLLYLVTTPIAILKVITSFTVAHSLTLALSAFELVSLSAAPVEAVIAGSIVLLALENLQRHKRVGTTVSTSMGNYPVFIAFAFGLLHGLGFAGALAEIGLPEQSQLMALLLFNLGIEAGQLFIVFVVLLIVNSVLKSFLTTIQSWCDRAPLAGSVNVAAIAWQAPVYFAGGIASLWFIQRSWLILLRVVG